MIIIIIISIIDNPLKVKLTKNNIIILMLATSQNGYINWKSKKGLSSLKLQMLELKWSCNSNKKINEIIKRLE